MVIFFAVGSSAVESYRLSVQAVQQPIMNLLVTIWLYMYTSVVNHFEKLLQYSGSDGELQPVSKNLRQACMYM